MNTTILVWIFVSYTVAVGGSGAPVYSPPVATLASCQKLEATLKELNHYFDGRCVQIEVPAKTIGAK